MDQCLLSIVFERVYFKMGSPTAQIYDNIKIHEPAFTRFIELESIANKHCSWRIAVVVLNRPKFANALDDELVSCLQRQLDFIRTDHTIRAVLFQGTGSHFCAGVDLQLMKSAATLRASENLQNAVELQQLFESIAALRVPTIGIARGLNYGGGVGLIACCDFSLSTTSARFCFSEVKKGIYPAIILPYLMWKMPAGQRRRFIMSAQPFSALEALELGLVQVVVKNSSLEKVLRTELDRLLLGSPEAQAGFKKLERDFFLGSQQTEQIPSALAESRASSMGQAGLECHFLNLDTPWACQLPNTTQLLI